MELIRVFRSVLSEPLMPFEEWTHLLPLIESALNNAPSQQWKNIALITALTGMDLTPPIYIFLRTTTVNSVTVSEKDRERILNLSGLQARVAELHPLARSSVRSMHERKRKAAERGELPTFTEGHFVLVAREDFFAGEKLALRCGRPRRILKAINGYFFQVEDLQNVSKEEVHGTRLKTYRGYTLDTNAIMSHVLSSETGMPVARLMRLIEEPDGLDFIVHWEGLPHSEDSFY